jgi:hypothetical protein
MSNKGSSLFRILMTVTCIFIIQLPGKPCAAQQRMDEFNGPFASWANVKTRFGAKGDGKTDDTKAFQRALDSLSGWLQKFNQGKTGYSVIYIPRGTYKITATLNLKGKMGIKIVGEDPANSTLLWQGNDNDTIFWANGSAYFSISRLQWDAGGRKNMEAIGMHWKQSGNGTYAPEQVEFTDLTFKAGFARGISAGTFAGQDGTGMNESEITIKRCSFNECTETGIMIKGFNALDYWVWYCNFIKCRVGVTTQSGNYHVYKSYFEQSGVSDVYNVNSYYTSVRYCFSVNSAAFSTDEGKGSNPFKRIFEGNTVTGITNIGIFYNHTGKITLLDNFFSAAAGIKSKKFLDYETWSPTHFDVLSLNNHIENFPTVYSLASPNRVFTPGQDPSKKAGPILMTVSAFQKSMPPVPSYQARTTFDVPVNSSSPDIQGIINKASALKTRAIVHFPFGVYNLVHPLVIPANSDIQIEGDGQLYASILQKQASLSFENGAALKILCPTTVSIKDVDFELLANSQDNGRAIALINADQKDATVLIDQLYADNDTSLLVKNYDYTLFQKTNSFFTTGNYVSGGREVQKGSGSMKVQCFGAQFANCTLEQNATFVARDCWWEGPASVPINLKGSGNFIIEGGMIAPQKLDSSTIVSIGNFSGKVGLMDMYLIGSIDIKKDNPSLQFLAWNINFYHKKRPLAFIAGNESYKAFFAGISSMCFNSKDNDCSTIMASADKTVNISSPDNFMDDMTKELRASNPIEYIKRPSGVTNFYLSRVAVNAKYKTGIAFTK